MAKDVFSPDASGQYFEFAQALIVTYKMMGDNIGYLALIPTGLILAYLTGYAIAAQKDVTHY